MRWIVYIAGSLALIAAVIALVGAMLPKGHAASRTARVAMPPEALYALLADVSQYPSWRKDVKSLERLPDRDGRPAWIENVGGMKIPLYFERMEPSSLLVARIADPKLPFGGTWTYRITPAAAGSELTITEDGEVSNVIFRFMSRFVFGYHATIDAFIKHLQARNS
jgi:polyketide cyclase/dehydrase/lipid transport protein